MIIDRFGATYATALQLPTLKAEDDWSIERPEVVQRVGGMNGVFDFYGDRNFPIGSKSIRKTFNLTDPRALTSSGPGTGVITFITGFTTVSGLGTLFLTELAVGDSLTVGAFSAIVTSIIDDENAFVDTAPAANIIQQGFIITRPSSYVYLETLLQRLVLGTVAAGETKLWGLLRDGTRHWAWAKCVSLKPPETYTQKLVWPIEIGFSVKEGVWYAETESAVSVHDHASPYTFSRLNAGNQPALLKATLLNNAASALTLPKLENLTNGLEWTFNRAGTTADVEQSHSLVVDAAAAAVTYDGADAYASLALGATQVVFMQLEPGVNSMRFSATITGSPDYDLTLQWFDTYL